MEGVSMCMHIRAGFEYYIKCRNAGHPFVLMLLLQLLLGYLPPSPEDWHRDLAKKRTQYHLFCDVGGFEYQS